MKALLSRQSILTPPNAISVLGFVLTLIGCTQLNSWQGLGFVVIGRLLDLADGWLARRYHQTSRFGALLDASLDKLSLLVIMIAMLYYGMVPLFIVIAIIIQNVTNAAATWLAARRHPGRTLAPSRAGKYAMAFQGLALAAFIVSYLILPPLEPSGLVPPDATTYLLTWSSAAFAAGLLFTALGVFVLGLWATIGYIRRAV